MTVKNAKILPRVYYGLHFSEGVAEYREPGREPYRILVNENTIKNMDPTFEGRPVYVRHVDEVDLENIQTESDGYVVESFFNKADGKHWAKFIVVSDKGHEAIRAGWKLSNAYIPKGFATGGLWHGVEYIKEVTNAEYEHLAIVPNPRYEESVIMTPEQFKQYNERKEIELKKLSNSNPNSKGENMSLLKFFSKKSVENSADLETMSVLLPKSKKEKTIAQLVNESDDSNMPDHMANGEHKVQVGEEKMTVNDLVQKHLECMNELSVLKKPVESEKSDGDVAPVKQNEESEEEKEKKKNAEAAAEEEKKKNAEEAEKAEKAKKNALFETLKNAPSNADTIRPVVELSEDRVARGKSRYGAQK